MGIDIGATPRSSVPDMASIRETGFLLIADLTGYTAYLAGSEIEHAPAIAGDLLETIVGRLEPPFRLSKFEGDAAFFYAEDGRADGSLLIDAIEAAYVAFRRRLRSIDQATSCDCNSCRLAPRLDLKVFVHHGDVRARQHRGSRRVGRFGRHPRPSPPEGRPPPPRPAATATSCSRPQRSRPWGSILPPSGYVRARRPSSISVASRPSPWISRLAGRWRPATRRVEIADADVILDVQTTLAAEPSVVWAPPDVPRTPDAVGRAAGHRGDVRRWASRRGNDRPVRDRQACDPRRDRRLAALRPRLLAPRRADARSGRGNGRSRRGGRRHPAPDPLGLRWARCPPTTRRWNASAPTRRPPTSASQPPSLARARAGP